MRLFSDLYRKFNKHKYLRVTQYSKDKSSKVNYYKNSEIPKDLLINPDHVFIHGGYRTVLTTDASAQTINPLDFKSVYPRDMFTSAIESKLIHETFASLKKPTMDITKLLLVANVVIGIAILYFLISKDGGINI
ncbi:MAG: hypothetical protein QXN68_02665 [Thermoplasmata archaeon]